MAAVAAPPVGTDLWMAALQMLEMEAKTPLPYTCCLVSLQCAGHLAMNSGRLIFPALTSHSMAGTTADETRRARISFLASPLDNIYCCVTILAFIK